MLNFEIYKENAEERLSYTSSDTPRSFIRALEDIVKLCKYGQNLETENRALQERAHMRQELVEQYEQDIARLRQKVRELEQQTVVLASYLSKHVMHTMSTKEWLEWSENVAKEKCYQGG